jgi:spore coat protein U-like protein
MYNNGLNYCAYAKPPEAPPGDVVADNNGPTIDGSRTLINQVFTLTHKVSVNQSQTAGQYQTTLRLMITANY